MKSIVEEASSIVKAVEKAWLRAGKPASFQVKIFEEPQKNFFGLTVRSAKIGLFFDEKVEKIEKATKPELRVAKQELRREKRYPSKGSRDAREMPKDQEQRKEKTQRSRWNPDMIKASREWLDQTLETMGYRGIRYSMDPKGYYLNILFQKPILADKSKEQMLFKSLSHLMIQMLRTKFKKGFIGFKVVLKGA